MTEKNFRTQMLNEIDTAGDGATRFEEDVPLCLTVDGAQLGSQEQSMQGVGLS